MANYLSITRAQQTTGSFYGKMGYKLTFTAVGLNDFPSEIFRYIRRPVDPGNPTATQEDVFTGIVTYEELISLPVNNPRDNDEPQYCRKDTAELILPSESLATETEAAILADAQMLVNAKKASDRLNSPETFTISA